MATQSVKFTNVLRHTEQSILSPLTNARFRLFSFLLFPVVVVVVVVVCVRIDLIRLVEHVKEVSKYGSTVRVKAISESSRLAAAIAVVIIMYVYLCDRRVILVCVVCAPFTTTTTQK